MNPYSKQEILEEDIQAVVKDLKNPILTGGSTVDLFETKIAEYVGAKYAVVFNSGTAALHSAYFVAGLKENDEFITSSMSFVATTNGGVYLGGNPVLVDIKFDGNIDVSKIEEKITSKTKLIAPVDYAGNPCDIEEIMKIGKKHNLIVVEDGSHSLGSSINGKKIGSIADMKTFSFHPVKPITTFEGGAVTTNNKEFYEKLKKFRSHGVVKKSLWNQDMEDLGFNYRLSDVPCALGISQLRRLDSFIKKRNLIGEYYDEALKDLKEISTVRIKENRVSGRHLYPILLDRSLWCSKEDIFQKLQEKAIGVQVHYKPIHKHSFYRQKINKSFSNAEDFYKAEISIPCHQSMSLDDAKEVVETLKEVFNTQGVSCVR
ncbi:MAG: UDP-4-amino-4,6-dideoxy-N-acetyl-beta-L-altrosamine transaminase [Campylobacterales bacterium]|nr:UDP-4-amino-4,6-dideoxy-N-acetyl-beta-L-altrosamine transaminase [Campylobacterales bacterium]